MIANFSQIQAQRLSRFLSEQFRAVHHAQMRVSSGTDVLCDKKRFVIGVRCGFAPEQEPEECSSVVMHIRGGLTQVDYPYYPLGTLGEPGVGADVLEEPCLAELGWCYHMPEMRAGRVSHAIQHRIQLVHAVAEEHHGFHLQVRVCGSETDLIRPRCAELPDTAEPTEAGEFTLYARRAGHIHPVI